MSDEDKGLNIDRVLSYAANNKVSDIHLKVRSKPIVRQQGVLRHLDTDPMDQKTMTRILRGLVDERQQQRFDEEKNLDAAVQMDDESGISRRYRLNVSQDRRGTYMTIRVIPDEIIDIQQIGFPYDIWKDVVALKRGMVLVTGITNSGKTTTLASLIQEINKTRKDRIITLEDPVEYVHQDLKSVISQRELGHDVLSYADGVKYALRQDPDVILVGEIRDRETAYHALQATATGHLVFSTLHTINASETVRRYVDLFETDDHENIRNSLAANLAYVFSQQLIPYQKGVGRTLGMEVMNVQASPAVRNHLREGKYHLIQNDMQTGKSQRMLTMDQHLKMLVQSERISVEDAILHAHEPDKMRKDYGR